MYFLNWCKDIDYWSLISAVVIWLQFGLVRQVKLLGLG